MSNGHDENGAPREDAGFFQKLLGVFVDRSHSARESIEDALGEHETVADHLSPRERSMLRNVLDLRDRRVEDVMVPRADISAVEHTASIESVIRDFCSGGHSRLPIYRDTLDDPLGMIHIKDLVVLMVDQATPARQRKGTAPKTSIDFKRVDLSKEIGKTKIIRDVLYVPPSMPVGDLMVKMQTTRIHLALVVDEYGGTDGLVSIEDLVEEIVGEIEDEHDERTGPPIVSAGNGIFVADARASLEDLQTSLEKEIVAEDVAEEVDTIGGLIFHHAGRVPVRGELLKVSEDVEFEIIEADARRIKRVKIKVGKEQEKRKARRARRPSASDTGSGTKAEE